MTSSLGSVGPILSAFFDWWLGELRSLWRPVLRRLNGGKALVLSVSGETWMLRQGKNGQSKVLVRAETAGGALPSGNAFKAVLRNRKWRGAQLTILLPGTAALCKRLTLPDLGAADLRQALYFEIDRQTPFRPHDVYFDYRSAQRDPQSKRVSVELVTVPKPVAEPVLEQARQWGLKPVALDVAFTADQGAGIDLLKSATLESGQTRWTKVSVAFGLAVLSLLGAVFYIPLYQLGAVDTSLAEQVAVEDQKASRTIAMRSKLAARRAASDFLDQRKAKTAGALPILEDLTKALPDTTWITTLSENGSQVRISGYSAAAADLIQMIDAVPIFRNPSFSSPIVQDPDNKRERFDITFDVGASTGSRP